MTNADHDPFVDIRADVAQSRRRYLETVEPHRPEPYRFARGLTATPWDAEDLVQETLMRAFSALGTYSGRVANLRAYLFRTATNAWIDHPRRQRPVVVPADELDAPEEIEQLGPEGREALERQGIGLQPTERAAVLLKDVFDFSLKDLAAALNGTVGPAKSALHRGRSKLAALSEAVPLRHVAASEVVYRFVERFNRHDVEGLLSLVTEDCRTVIPGVVDDSGRGMARSVLTHTLEESTLVSAQRQHVAGEAVLVLNYRVEGGEAIGDVVRIPQSDGRITGTRWYYFCPDVLRDVGAQLGLPVRTQRCRPPATKSAD